MSLFVVDNLHNDPNPQNSALPTARWTLAHEFNVLALVKGQERYVFVYDDTSRRQLVDAFRDQAADPTLSLTWFDALVLTKKVREEPAGREEEVVLPEEEAPRSRILDV